MADSADRVEPKIRTLSQMAHFALPVFGLTQQGGDVVPAAAAGAPAAICLPAKPALQLQATLAHATGRIHECCIPRESKQPHRHSRTLHRSGTA